MGGAIAGAASGSSVNPAVRVDAAAFTVSPLSSCWAFLITNTCIRTCPFFTYSVASYEKLGSAFQHYLFFV